MRRRARLRQARGGIVLLVVSVVVAAVLAACKRDLPAPRFPHRVHLAGLRCGGPAEPKCLDCNTCHTPSERDRAHKLPAGALCESCHRADAREVLASLAVQPERPVGRIGFDHDRHLAMPQIRGQCLPCHAGVVEPGRATLPPMSQCFTCHEHQAEWDRGECAPCHTRADLARTLPKTFLRHDESFARHHGTIAAERQEQHLCSSCHTEAQCQACHDTSQGLRVELRFPERVESRQVHRGDFMVRHALEARSEPARCLSCHSPPTCDSCHVARGVSANTPNARNPHPPGWVGTNTTSSEFHGTAARRDILSCAACHDQGPATNCIDCHRVGAYGGNPHPPGWRSQQGFDARMCRYCHE